MQCFINSNFPPSLVCLDLIKDPGVPGYQLKAVTGLSVFAQNSGEDAEEISITYALCGFNAYVQIGQSA
jgi:hypothetical protein